MIFLDYGVCRSCSNLDSYGVTCLKCGKCGRKFKGGILKNGDEYPTCDEEEENDE